MATDIYNGTKRWLVKRFSKNEKASAQVITIYVNGNPDPTDSGQKRRSHRGHDTSAQGYR
jgi:hypothetical protein